jgi:hypothetical protein
VSSEVAQIFSPDSVLSDVDDHTYSATTPKVYFEEVPATSGFTGKEIERLKVLDAQLLIKKFL